MDFDISMLYGPIMIVSVAILGMIINFTKETKKDYSKFKGKYTTFFLNLLYSLSIMGGFATILGFFTDFINYRVAWVYDEIEEVYSFTMMSANGDFYYIIDSLFILYILIVLFIYYKRTNYRDDTFGKGFIFEGKSQLDFVLYVPFILAPLYSLPALFAFIGTVSIPLIGLSLIPVGMISYMFHVYEKKILTTRVI